MYLYGNTAQLNIFSLTVNWTYCHNLLFLLTSFCQLRNFNATYRVTTCRTIAHIISAILCAIICAPIALFVCVAPCDNRKDNTGRCSCSRWGRCLSFLYFRNKHFRFTLLQIYCFLAVFQIALRT